MAGPEPEQENPLGDGGEGLHDGCSSSRRGAGARAGGRRGEREHAGRRGGAANVGADVMGRNMFGGGPGPWRRRQWKGWWGDDPPYHTPSSCSPTTRVTPWRWRAGQRSTSSPTASSPRSTRHGGRRRQGRRSRGGADIVQQYLAAGLVDEIELHVVPILLGDGRACSTTSGRGVAARAGPCGRGPRRHAPQVPGR